MPYDPKTESESMKAEKKAYEKGDAYDRYESPSKSQPMDTAKMRESRSSKIKADATAYKKMSESDTDAVGRGTGASGKRHMKYGR